MWRHEVRTQPRDTYPGGLVDTLVMSLYSHHVAKHKCVRDIGIVHVIWFIIYLKLVASIVFYCIYGLLFILIYPYFVFIGSSNFKMNKQRK